MFGSEELKTLQLRKQALLLESELNRLTLSVECQRLPRVGIWADRITNVSHAAGPWVRALAPVAGIALALGICRASKVLVCFSKVAAFLPPMIRIWRAVAAPSTVTK